MNIPYNATDINFKTILYDEFSNNFDKYPINCSSIYHIVRDLLMKNEVENINIFDGIIYGFPNYMIECEILKDLGGKRILVPHSIDVEMDLQWLYSFLNKCKMENIEVYICFHTPECIIYELAEIGIP